MLTAALLIPLAAAESAGTLPAGSDVIYAGLGGATFNHMRQSDGQSVSSGERDRYLAGRLDLYFAHGLTDRLQLSAWAPVGAAVVLEDSAGLPCPSVAQSDDPDFQGYCNPTVSAGVAGVEGRFKLTGGAVDVTAGLAAAGDPWNAGTRGRYTALGHGTLGLAPALFVGRGFALGGRRSGVTAYGYYMWRFWPTLADEGALQGGSPPDRISGGLEWFVGWDHWTWQLGVQGAARPGGLQWDDSFAADYWPSSERWLALADSSVRAEVKASLALPKDSGLHIAVGQLLYSTNTAAWMTDFSVGVHRYFAP
jgi:hypothetical protein